MQQRASNRCGSETVVCRSAATQLDAVPSRTATGQAKFETLYQRHSRAVWTVVYAQWLDADLALDITQEAFLRLWKQLNTGETILNPRAWLTRVARNLAQDLAKSSFHRNGTSPPQIMHEVCASAPLPLESLEREETFTQLRAALEQMPPSEREILTLRYTLNYKPGQIAELLDITRPAATLRLMRARQRLVKRLTAART